MAKASKCLKVMAMGASSRAFVALVGYIGASHRTKALYGVALFDGAARNAADPTGFVNELTFAR